jgi:hypothetical protein
MLASGIQLYLGGNLVVAPLFEGNQLGNLTDQLHYFFIGKVFLLGDISNAAG